MEVEKIKINYIPDQSCDLYAPDETFIGVIQNEYSFNDIRIQIQQQQLSGYYVVWKELKIEIFGNGRYQCSEGLYDTSLTQLSQIISHQNQSSFT